jgi:hypothetical protein
LGKGCWVNLSIILPEMLPLVCEKEFCVKMTSGKAKRKSSLKLC